MRSRDELRITLAVDSPPVTDLAKGVEWLATLIPPKRRAAVLQQIGSGEIRHAFGGEIVDAVRHALIAAGDEVDAAEERSNQTAQPRQMIDIVASGAADRDALRFFATEIVKYDSRFVDTTVRVTDEETDAFTGDKLFELEIYGEELMIEFQVDEPMNYRTVAQKLEAAVFREFGDDDEGLLEVLRQAVRAQASA